MRTAEPRRASRFAVIATPSILRRVARKYTEKLTDDRNDPREAPGIGRALLVVLLMLGITAVLCILVYGVMIAIRPIEARQYRKAADLEQISPHSPNNLSRPRSG